MFCSHLVEFGFTVKQDGINPDVMIWLMSHVFNSRVALQQHSQIPGFWDFTRYGGAGPSPQKEFKQLYKNKQGNCDYEILDIGIAVFPGSPSICRCFLYHVL